MEWGRIGESAKRVAVAGVKITAFGALAVASHEATGAIDNNNDSSQEGRATLDASPIMGCLLADSGYRAVFGEPGSGQEDLIVSVESVEKIGKAVTATTLPNPYGCNVAAFETAVAEAPEQLRSSVDQLKAFAQSGLMETQETEAEGGSDTWQTVSDVGFAVVGGTFFVRRRVINHRHRQARRRAEEAAQEAAANGGQP